ncbi:MAG: hypothetical protein JXB07_10825 [Anaerolineae bacterium]|nr:hypothetical protein [Anaerolineae bacterium]
MNDKICNFSKSKRNVGWVMLTTIFLLFGCQTRSPESPTPSPDNISFDTRPFVEMAQKASCTDIKNKLYVIDDQFVFWTKEGFCDDGRYAHVLYGKSLREELCYSKESFAALESCQPAYEELFNTILQNLERPDLGLGSTHKVIEIRLAFE